MVKVTGTVFQQIGNQSEFFPSVNIRIDNETNSTQTDENGNFTIWANNSSSKILFSHVGYQTTELTAYDVLQNKFIELIPESELLLNVDIPKPKPNNNQKTNYLLWILGITTLAFVGYSLIKNQPKKVKM